MGGLEAAGGAAQDQAGRTGPWLWQGWQWGTAAGEGGRHLNPLACLWLDVRPLRPAEAWVGKHAACVVDAGQDRIALLLERGEPGRLGGWAGRPCRLAWAAACGDASVQEAERGNRS